MNISQAVYSHLKSVGAITSLSSNRIYPLVAPQNSLYPHIIYHQISNPPPVHTMIADPKISRYRFQISSWATNYSGVIALSTQVKTAFRDKTGTIGSSNFNVQRIFFDNETDIPDINPATKNVIFHRALDFIIWSTG